MERRFAVHAGAREKVALALALVVAAVPAYAAPKSKAARAAFDVGVKAYQKKDFAAAAEALGKSFGLETDAETLFAWAQAERQQDHCDKAIELYKRLLELKLPDENRKAVVEKLDECKAIVAALQKPAKDPDPSPKPDPTPIEPSKPNPDADKPVPDRGGVPVDRPSGHRPWFKQPIGDALLVTGAIGIGVGAYFLASARSADADAHAHPGSDVVLQRLDDKAKSDGRTGMIAVAAGGALVIAGVIYYVTRTEPKTAVTGWLAPGSGGVAATGRF